MRFAPSRSRRSPLQKLAWVFDVSPAAFSCLTQDEAEFVDAAFERILPGAGFAVRGSRYLDRKLSDLDSQPRVRRGSDAREQDTVAIYRAGIAAVQSHCIRTYDRRFQALHGHEQLTVLFVLEHGQGFGGITQFQALSAMLVNDAAEAYFDGHRQAEPRRQSVS